MKHVLALSLLLFCSVAVQGPGEARPASPSEREPAAPSLPLPEEVLVWLRQLSATPADGKRPTPPEGWELLDIRFGDLNGDGREDLAVVLEEPPDKSGPEPDAPGIRPLVIFLSRSEGDRTIAHINTDLVLDRKSGGPFGDPYEGVAIEDGSLSISHYGGSNFRWGCRMTFRYVHGLFRLAALYSTDIYAGTGNGEETLCDFLNNTVERRSLSYDNTEWDLLLYRGNLEGGPYLFDGAEFERVIALAELPFLPNLDLFNFGRPAVPTRIGPDEALERIKKAYHPDFVEVRLTLTPEMKAAYAKLQGYEPAGRYYRGAGGTLEYRGLDTPEDDEGRVTAVYHSIAYRRTDRDASDVQYTVNDSDGTILGR